MIDYCPNCNRELIGDFVYNGCVHYIGKYSVEYFPVSNHGLPKTTYINLNGKIIFAIDKLIPIENEQRIELLLMLK